MAIKNIKVDKCHESKICKDVELEALTIFFKEQAAKLQVPKAIFEFDNILYLLVIKHLKKIPRREIERVYGEKTVAQLILDELDMERRYPEPTQVLRHPYIC
jgi:hypothetical protein